MNTNNFLDLRNRKNTNSYFIHFEQTDGNFCMGQLIWVHISTSLFWSCNKRWSYLQEDQPVEHGSVKRYAYHSFMNDIQIILPPFIFQSKDCSRELENKLSSSIPIRLSFHFIGSAKWGNFKQDERFCLLKWMPVTWY